MKNILILPFILSFIFCLGQGVDRTKIDWIELHEAEKYSQKYNKTFLFSFTDQDVISAKE